MALGGERAAFEMKGILSRDFAVNFRLNVWGTLLTGESFQVGSFKLKISDLSAPDVVTAW